MKVHETDSRSNNFSDDLKIMSRIAWNLIAEWSRAIMSAARTWFSFDEQESFLELFTSRFLPDSKLYFVNDNNTFCFILGNPNNPQYVDFPNLLRS